VRLPGRELEALLGPALPADHARQTLPERYIEHRLGRVEGRPWRVLDLGCGRGDSVDAFRAQDPAVEWVGLDQAHSREVDARTRADARFETFDGVSIPFDDGSFDVVYCKQVMEHVRHPASLLAEVGRVLRDGGLFAGSTSQFEPFHSMSFWNYTPVGFAELLSEAGMRPTELRPGIDGLTLIGSRLVGPRRIFERWWGGQSPLNRAIDGYARLRHLPTPMVNATKLLFCGQFAFVAERAAP
jgi:SAM-dependent methyltransferase